MLKVFITNGAIVGLPSIPCTDTHIQLAKIKKVPERGKGRASVSKSVAFRNQV